MSYLVSFQGSNASVAADTLPSAVAPSSTDGVLVVQPSNASAPHSVTLMGPGAFASFAANNPVLVGTMAAPNPMVLDHTNHGRTLVATGAMTVLPPATAANLGSTSGDGFQTRLLNGGGFPITFGTNGGFGITVPGGATSSSVAGVYEFYSTVIGGTLQFVAGLPSVAVVAGPSLAFGSVSSAQPGAASTVSYTFAGGAPAGFSAALNGAAVSTVSGPTITVTSGTGASAAGTIVFGMINPGVGSYVLSAAGTGSFAATAAPHTLVIAAVPALVFTSVSTTTVGMTATVVVGFSGGLPASASVTLDGAAATLASGPVISSTSGSAGNSAGAITFSLVAPAAGVHSLGLATTGAYAATMPPYSWTTTVASPKMLDGLAAGSAAAFGLRRLRAAYAGSAIRVNRSTDNVQQDIGFTAAGSLDTGALSTFVGSASGTVAKWYDQSGSGNDAVMAYVPSQPTIVSAGTVQMAGGLPTLSFVGTGVGLFAPFAVSGGSLSAAAVVQNAGVAANLRVLTYAPASTPDYASAASAIVLQNGFSTATASQIAAVRNSAGFGGGAAQSTTGPITAAAVFNGSTAAIYANGVLQGSAGSSTGSFGATGQLGIGLPLNTGGPSWGAPISEVVVFASALSAGDLAAVQSSQKSFYGTP